MSNAVIEAPEQPGVVEVVRLLPGMGHDSVRVGHQQPPPPLPVLVPGPGLLGDEVGPGQDERGGEVVPVALAREVGHLEVVPRRLAAQPGKRRCRVEPLVHEHAVGGLDRLAVRFPGSVAARPRERGDGQPLVAGLALQDDVLQQARLAFQVPDRPGDRGCGAEPGELLPPPQAAVRVHRQCQQVSHVLLLHLRGGTSFPGRDGRPGTGRYLGVQGLERVDVDLGKRRERLDGVAEHRERDPGPDGQGGLL